jgi:hypothetical protein
MRKKLRLSSDGGDSGSKKCKRGYFGAYGGVWRKSGVRRSFYVGAVWQESGFSRHEDVFTFNLLFKKFYKFCTFNAICEGNAAINCITIQHKKGLFPSTLTGHTALVNVMIHHVSEEQYCDR